MTTMEKILKLAAFLEEHSETLSEADKDKIIISIIRLTRERIREGRAFSSGESSK